MDKRLPNNRKTKSNADGTRFAPAMIGPCHFHKENCHGRRLHAGEILRVGPSYVASGNGDRSEGRSTAEGASYCAESDLVRAGDELSLERCAEGDGLLWRNRTHSASSMGTRGHLASTASTVADDAESREAIAIGNGDHRHHAGPGLRRRRCHRSESRGSPQKRHEI